MDISLAITAFVTLFVIIDPVGLAPLFAALTRGEDPAARRGIALRACLIGLGVLLLFGLAGEAVLAFVGISMPAFQIAGGMLLFLTALDMLFERRTQRRENQAQDRDDPAVFPLATPLIAGPGAIATMILMAGQPGISWTDLLIIHLVMFGVVAITFVLFLASGLLERIFGHVGINVITRLLGILLAALSVQIILDGIRASGIL